MRTLNYAKICLLAVLAFSLAACGDKYYSDEYLRNSNEKLCSKTWVEEYTTVDNDLCKHQLRFSRDLSGRETYQFYRTGENRPYRENSYIFSWNWIDSDMENIEINYGGGDIIFFDNVWVREHNLQGKWDGEIVMFVDANYYN